MNEKDYQYTLAVAKCKSFSRAADLLYISQPVLSRYIAALEKELGVTLFDRSASPIRLTSAGGAVLHLRHRHSGAGGHDAP